jgi:hypothetical protein
MNQEDHNFENYLREFKPRQPRALPEITVSRQWHWQRLAAAAVIVVACGSAIWFTNERHEQSSLQGLQQRVPSASPAIRAQSYAALQRLALEDPARFDAALSAASQNILPRFDKQDSTLRVLAKD